jgi:putative ABC transport system permease protein
MLSNHFKVAWRQLVANKTTSTINILGLTVGLTCFILIALFVQYEMSYDRQHEKAGRIYRVGQIQQGNVFRGTDRFVKTPRVMAPALKADFPEVEAATTLQLEAMSLEKGGKVFTEVGLFSDEHLFEVFTFPLIAGNGKSALETKNGILLTKTLANKYFGNENPVGKTLFLQNKQALTVVGILEDLPKNQHFTFDFVTSYKNLPYYDDERWVSNNFLTYMALAEGTDPEVFEKKLTAFDKHIAVYKGLPFKVSFFLQPLQSIHLYSQANFELGINSDIRYIWLFSAIAFIILLLACINYINLATAKSVQRNKEVGVRKALGAVKRHLVSQFLAESVLLTFISFASALALAAILLPSFNQLLDKGIVFDWTSSRWLVAGMLATGLLIGGLAGLYPAVLLSATSPIKAFRGFVNKPRGGTAFRNTLVVGQFTASIVLAIGSLVVYQQLQFIQSKNPGYNRDGIVYIPFNQLDISNKAATVRAELLKNPQVEAVSFSKYIPLDMFSEGMINQWEGNETKENLSIYVNNVDYDFIDLFGMQLKEGRNFSPAFPTDSTAAYILNETAVKKLGWTTAVGKQFQGGQVIGVIKDFHFQSFGQSIKPLFLSFFTNSNQNITNLSIRVQAANMGQTLDFIQQEIKAILPHLPVECIFMEEDWYKLYESEQRLGQAFNLFTLLALFIACMGLFGLISHQVVNRTKEIGIRKVLGASVAGITGLLAKDFLKLVAIAIVVASPIAYYFMQKWLSDFAYRIEIQWWMFGAAGAMAVLIAFLTVGFQSVKAALANPVKSLRSE